MTIRQLLVRKATTLAIVTLLLVVSAFAVMLLFGRGLGQVAALAIIVSLGVVPIASVYAFFRCPRCKACIGALIGHFGPMRRWGREVRHCPFCGVHLDGPAEP